MSQLGLDHFISKRILKLDLFVQWDKQTDGCTTRKKQTGLFFGLIDDWTQIMKFLVQPVKRNQMNLLAAVALEFKSAVCQLEQQFAAIAAFFLVSFWFYIRHILTYLTFEIVASEKLCVNLYFKVST